MLQAEPIVVPRLRFKWDNTSSCHNKLFEIWFLFPVYYPIETMYHKWYTRLNHQTVTIGHCLLHVNRFKNFGKICPIKCFFFIVGTAGKENTYK